MNRRLFPVAAATLALASPSFAHSGDITMRRVTFQSQGQIIVGELHLPMGVSALNPAPAIVVTGAWFTVKEQMPTRYAEELARRGFVALAFDFRGFGESGGEIRQRETPTTKIEDVIAAAAFLKAQPEVDANRVGGLGICASSGYMVAAATRTGDLRSVALVAPWLHDASIVDATYGGADGVARLIAAGRAAEASYEATGMQTFVPGASLTDRTAVMFGVPYYTEIDRGLIPAWRNEVDPAFWEDWLTFDAIQYAPHLTQPFAIVHSEAAAIPQGAHRFFAGVAGSKSELWLDGVSQLDFYDRGVPVTTAADAVAAHFKGTL
jgi:uncharacterized protein